MDREPKDSLGVFVGLRNVLLLYVAIAIAWLVASYLIGQEPCRHPVDMQRLELETEGFGLWIPGEEIICEVCGKVRSVKLPGVMQSNSHQPEVRAQIVEHQRYVAAVREAVKAREAAGIKTKVTTMSHGIQYEHPDRRSPAGSNDYFGATSRGVDKNVYWEIRWSGPYNSGPTAIDAVRATLDHLTHLQKTTAASESNAKLINHLVQAIEEFDGVKPTMGGELNNLIPKLED